MKSFSARINRAETVSRLHSKIQPVPKRKSLEMELFCLISALKICPDLYCTCVGLNDEF